MYSNAKGGKKCTLCIQMPKEGQKDRKRGWMRPNTY